MYLILISGSSLIDAWCLFWRSAHRQQLCQALVPSYEFPNDFCQFLDLVAQSSCALKRLSSPTFRVHFAFLSVSRQKQRFPLRSNLGIPSFSFRECRDTSGVLKPFSPKSSSMCALSSGATHYQAACHTCRKHCKPLGLIVQFNAYSLSTCRTLSCHSACNWLPLLQNDWSKSSCTYLGRWSTDHWQRASVYLHWKQLANRTNPGLIFLPPFHQVHLITIDCPNCSLL